MDLTCIFNYYICRSDNSNSLATISAGFIYIPAQMLKVYIFIKSIIRLDVFIG